MHSTDQGDQQERPEQPQNQYRNGSDIEQAIQELRMSLMAGKTNEASQIAQQLVNDAPSVLSPKDYRFFMINALATDAFQAANKLSHAAEQAQAAIGCATDLEKRVEMTRKLANIHRELGEPELMKKVLDDGIDHIDRSNQKNVALSIAALKLDLAAAHRLLGDPKRCNELIVETYLIIDRDVRPEDHFQAGRLLFEIANNRNSKGFFQDAVMLYTEAKKLIGNSSHVAKDVVIAQLNVQMAFARHDTGDFEGALHDGKLALDMLKKAPKEIAEQVDEVAWTLRMVLVDSLAEYGKPSKAQSVMRKLVSIAERKYGPDDQRTLDRKLTFAGLLYDSCNIVDAEQFLSSVQQSLDKKLGDDLSQAIQSLDFEKLDAELPKLMHAIPSEAKEALAMYPMMMRLQAIVLLSTSKGEGEALENAEAVLKKTMVLGEYVLSGSLQKSFLNNIRLMQIKLSNRVGSDEDALEAIYAVQREVKPREDRAASAEYAQALHAEGDILKDLSRYDEAEDAYRESLQILESVGRVANTKRMVPALSSLAALRMDLGDTAEAKELLERAYNILENRGASLHGLMIGVCNGLAQIAEGESNMEVADEYKKKAGAAFNELDYLNDFRLFDGPPDIM